MEYGPKTALVVVDVQNDFADPDGSLYVQGGEDVIPFINEQVATALESGARIAYSQDWHPETTPHFAKDGGIWPVHCLADSEGAAFHPELNLVDNAIFIKKGVGGEDGYSAFTMRDPVTGEETPTGLKEELESIESILVVGLALDYCVKETALDAARSYDTTLLADGTRPVNLKAGDGSRAVAEMVAAGVAVV